MFLEAFSEQWREDVLRQKDKIYSNFPKNSEWTKFMQPKEGFLNRLMNRLPGSLHYRTEYYTIDSLYISGNDLLKKKELSYPSEVCVLIEHENQDKVEEEMWKLAYWRAPLKVIIFYDYNDKAKENNLRKQAWLIEKISDLVEMLKVINNYYSENEDTEYLFIVGARKEAQGEIYWKWASNKSLQPTNFVGG